MSKYYGDDYRATGTDGRAAPLAAPPAAVAAGGGGGSSGDDANAVQSPKPSCVN